MSARPLSSGNAGNRWDSLFSLARLLTGGAELEAVLREILRVGMEVGGADRAAVYLYDVDRERLSVGCALGLSEEYLAFLVGFFRQVPGSRVLETRAPLWIRDAWHDPEARALHEAARKEGFRSYSVFPLLYREQVLGALVFYYDALRDPDPELQRLFGVLADYAALAVANFVLLRQAQQRAEALAVLREIDAQITAGADPEALLETVALAIRQLPMAHTFFIGLYDPLQEELYFPVFVDRGERRPPLRLRASETEGLAAWVIRTGEPLWIRDYLAEKDRLPVPPVQVGDVTRSIAMLPLKVESRVFGVLSVQSYEPYAFSSDDRRLLEELAAQTAIALENARLYREEQRRREEAESLYRAAQAITTSLDLREVLERILTELARVVPYDSASVQLLREGCLEIIACRGFPNPGEIVGLRIDPDRPDNPNGQVLSLRAPVILEDAPALYEAFRQPPHAAAGIRAWMGVPLLYGERAIGMLTLDKRQPGFYREEHARLALAFAGQAAIAIENARIYRQLEERSGELAQALRKLQELDRLREQMIQNVSHEFRTPLTLAYGYAELLLRGDLGPLQPAQRAALEIVFERIQALGRIVTNLTTFRALQAGALVVAPTAIPEVVEWVCSRYRSPAARAGIELIPEVPADLPKALADREHLALALSQLVENAIKFSPGGGNVWIRAWSDESWVYLAVEDQGIGIPPEHLDRIFERFYQVDGSSTRRFGGMGIGLALVWEIMEALQGKVDVASEVGKGSRFTLSLRRARSPEAA